MPLSFPTSISICYLLPLLILVILGFTIGPSLEVSNQVRCIKKEAIALLDFKKSFTSTYLCDTELLYWNSPDEDCCEWYGIKCNIHTGHVVSLNLSLEILMSNQLRPSLLELHHLRILDLSWNDFSMTIPAFIGSLSKLTYLDLSHSGFYGKVPPHLGNFSSLQTLILNGQDNNIYIDNCRWISRLSTLERLDMSYLNLSDARDCLSTVGALPLLSSFSCSSCSLPLTLGDHHVINSSTSLEIIDLSYNTLSSSIISWLINSRRNLLELHLAYMNTNGPFPDLFQNIVSLRSLHLSGNHLDQRTLESIGKLCNLKELVVSECGMNQSLTNILQTINTCASSSLEILNLGSNNLTGPFPSMMKFPSLIQLNLSSIQLDSFSLQDSSLLPKLETLDISFNGLTNLKESLRHLPSSLKGLYLSSNCFSGVISDTQVSNFTKLKTLDLSYNPNLNLSFIKPPFQLEYIGLRSCSLGPDFPTWLRTQKAFSWLDISSSMISDSIPVMFWNNLVNLPSSLSYLNLSFNDFHGSIPNLQFPNGFDYAVIDLSSNAFDGSIPCFFFCTDELILSNNRFSSFAPFADSTNSSTVFQKPQTFTAFIDLSNNLLSGTIPSWFWNFETNALGLSLANNRLSGEIPSSVGLLSEAHFLSLANNSFYGELPSSLKNCTRLGLLDLSGNKLTGNIPDWIGENLVHLIILSLRLNNFSGYLPSTLCHLTSLQILDLSHNELSGNIPSCVSNFSAMAGDVNSMFQVVIALESSPVVHNRLEALFSYPLFDWKGKDRTFHKDLLLLISVDLSNNELSGEIPMGFTSLVKLHSLDLSINNLTGSIPAKIGVLTSLETLNLAWNNLGGEIPSSLAQVTSLSKLDVSHNNLSGKIPISTQLQSFDSSAYDGNFGLCGLPLPNKCPGDGGPVPQPYMIMAAENTKKWDMESFYGALGTGFAFGLLAILGAVNFFQFANDIVNSMLLAVLAVLR